LIPDHTHSGVLPPFLPNSAPHASAAMAPYKVDFFDFAKKFSTSTDRIKILLGLAEYRAALRSIGINNGFQWIDGSFVENCEVTRGRAPNDIDLITFSSRPDHLTDSEAWKRLVVSRPDIFDPEQSKKSFYCDAYFVDLKSNPIYLVNQTKYWFGLFSHQRDTFLWKGMLELSLDTSDEMVKDFLSEELHNATQA